MRAPPDISGVFNALFVIQPDLLDRDGVALGHAQVAALKAWADSIQVRLTRRGRELAAEGAAEAPVEMLGKHGRETGRGAALAEAREKTCSNLPGFEDALAEGSISSGHVDAISNVTKGDGSVDVG